MRWCRKIQGTCHVILLALSALDSSTASASQQRRLGPLCERSFRADFQCESGRYGTYDKAAVEERETKFCDQVKRDSSILIEQSVARGTSVASYWSSSRGKQELEDVRQFCSQNGIDQMRRFFCRTYRPRCTPVLAELDRKEATCSNSKDCLEKARRREQEALEELASQKKENESALTAASSAFASLMDRAARYHEAKERALADYPEMKRELQQDRTLLEAAIRSVGRPGAFEAIGDSASQTQDPGLRGLLLLASAARAVQEGSELNRDELLATETSLRRIYEKTSKNEEGMAGLPASSITGLPNAESEAKPERAASLLSTVLQISAGEEAHASVPAAEAIAGPPKAAVKPQGPTLREILAKKLREGQEKGGSGDASVASLVNPAELIAVAESQMEKTAGEDSGGRAPASANAFRIGESGDPAMRARELEEVQMGILPASSETLFERVRRAHRAAEEAGRVE